MVSSLCGSQQRNMLRKYNISYVFPRSPIIHISVAPRMNKMPLLEVLPHLLAHLTLHRPLHRPLHPVNPPFHPTLHSIRRTILHPTHRHIRHRIFHSTRRPIRYRCAAPDDIQFNQFRRI